MRRARSLRFPPPDPNGTLFRGAVPRRARRRHRSALLCAAGLVYRRCVTALPSPPADAAFTAFIAVTLLIVSPFFLASATPFVSPFSLAGAARAAQTPSPDLSFRITLTPDSITVGDPIAVVIEAAGPPGATLLLPQIADSVGPFTVLDAGPPVAGSRDGKVTVRRTAKVTRFRTGPASFPELPLLWVRAPGDTAVAFSTPVPVRVRSLLTGPADASKLHDLKPVVPLVRPRWWLWGLIALGAAALAFAAWRYRHFLRRRRIIVEPPPLPPLPPEVAFEAGLESLLARRLPEHGLVKDYYGELSLLFRRYLEDRLGFLALEETRREIMVSVEGRTDLRAEEIARLGEWLTEDELVKFAKMERLLGEVGAHTDRARAWVRATTPPPAALPGISPIVPPPSLEVRP